jgi:DNA-binding FrmR family transcriptional regulator
VNRISGQIGGIGKMIDDDRYCLEILDQIAAARSALDALAWNFMTGHLESCVVGTRWRSAARVCQTAKPEELLEEVRTSLRRF